MSFSRSRARSTLRFTRQIRPSPQRPPRARHPGRERCNRSIVCTRPAGRPSPSTPLHAWPRMRYPKNGATPTGSSTSRLGFGAGWARPQPPRWPSTFRPETRALRRSILSCRCRSKMEPSATQPLRRRFLASLVALFVGLVAILFPAPARADEAGDNELPPRDVSMVVQPAAVSLGPLPSEFQRIDAGWIAFEFPGSARSRVEPLVREAEGFRARLAEDLGQPVLAHALVRVARTPDQMNQLSPRGAPPPEYAAAVAYPSEHLVLLSMQAPYTWDGTDLAELLGHELAHV